MSIEILENLRKAVIQYDSEGAAIWAKKAIEKGIDPMKALAALTDAIRQIGNGYGRGEFFLPDLVGAAKVMTNATPIIEEEIKRSGKKREFLGTIVIGTVYGDIHSIGKTMVATLLTAEGFEVIDLGVNVTAHKFMEAIRKYQPHIIAMSALMTITAPEQKKVVSILKKEGLRDKVKIMIGGAAVTQEFAESIGVDGYEATAPDGVKLAKRLIGMG